MGLYKIPQVIGIGQKPPFGARVNPYHPLSQGLVGAWLFNEGGGNNYYDSNFGVIGTADPTTAPAWKDNGLYFDGSDDVLSIPYDDAPFLDAITIVNKSCIDSGSAYRHFAGKHAGGGGSANPFDYRTDDSATPIMNLVRTGSGLPGIWSGPACTIGKYKTYGFTHTSGNLDAHINPIFYIDGISTVGTVSSWGVGSVTGSQAPIRIGIRTDGAVKMQGTNEFFFFWNRALSAAEMMAVYANPYQMFWRPMRDIYIVPAAAPAVGVPTHMDYYRRMRER